MSKSTATTGVQKLFSISLCCLITLVVDALSANAEAQAQTRVRPRSLVDPAKCESRDYLSTHNWDNRDVDVALAVCASGAPVGSARYVEFWAGVAKTCGAGKEPKALWDVMDRVPFIVANSFSRLWCDDIFKLVKRLEIPVDVGQERLTQQVAQNQKAQALQQLRRNADAGSPSAKFILAAALLDLENANHFQGPTLREGVELLASLAKSGYENEVAKLVTDAELKYPADPSKDLRYTVYMQIYGALARANDPRGWVRLAEDKYRSALWDRRANNRPGMLSALDVTRDYLSRARSKASGDLLKYVDKLDQSAVELQNSPTAAHVLTSAIVSGLGFIGTWQRAGGDAAMKRWDDCRQNKAAADVDPTLRLAFSQFRCYAY